MSNIERWTLALCRDAGCTFHGRPGAPMSCYDHGHKVEEVEVAPADQLRGAVDVERIARVLAEHIVGVTVRQDEPVEVCRFHRDLARAVVGEQYDASVAPPRKEPNA